MVCSEVMSLCAVQERAWMCVQCVVEVHVHVGILGKKLILWNIDVCVQVCMI